MKDTVIRTSNRPRTRRVTGEMEGRNSVRAFRTDPESVQLQIRGENTFTNAAMLAPEVEQLIAALQEGLKEIRR